MTGTATPSFAGSYYDPMDVDPAKFNSRCQLPHGLTGAHVRSAMEDFIKFLRVINQQLHQNNMASLESFLMPANFSSITGEFMNMTLPKHCSTIAKNNYHNGHPDLIPKGKYPNDSAQHGDSGIEVKGSRYLKAWQGHNAEDSWLMVFCFENTSSSELSKIGDAAKRRFRFALVAGAQLTKSDWNFSGRSSTSRRTITASVTDSGYQKMMANWIYKA